MSGRGIVEAEVFRSEQVSRLARTSDPASPSKGDAWIRTDVQPVTDSVAALRIQGDLDYLEVPLFDPSAATGSDVYVGQRFLFADGTEGHLLVTDQGGAVGSPRVVTSSGTLYEAHDALEVSTIPDSAIAQYDAQAAFGSGDEGSTTSSWVDELGNYDLSGGSPTVVGSGINGYRSVDFDGDDLLDNTNPTESQPNTIFLVTDAGFSSSHTTTRAPFSGPATARNQIGWSGSDTEWQSYAGSAMTGSGVTTVDTAIFTVVFDGTNSVSRVNGSEAISKDAGSYDLGGIALGARSDSAEYYDGLIGEAVVCNARVSSSDIQSEEQRLADKWDITI